VGLAAERTGRGTNPWDEGWQRRDESGREYGHSVAGCDRCQTAARGHRLSANAVYDAVGIRLYEMPFTPSRVLAAFKAEGT
jgi:hypothetical protein